MRKQKKMNEWINLNIQLKITPIDIQNTNNK